MVGDVSLSVQAKDDRKLAPPSHEPLSQDVMKALGFAPIWPSGNGTEPWWEAAVLIGGETRRLFFFDAPSLSGLAQEIWDAASREKQQDIRRTIAGALGL